MEGTEQTLNFADSSDRKKKKKGSTSTGTNPLEVTIDFSLCLKYAIKPEHLLQWFAKITDSIELDDLLHTDYAWVTERENLKELEEALKKEFIKENCFDELLAAFPKETPDGRKLRTDTDKARKAYDKITKKSPSAHEHIMSCLQTEIKERNKTGQMKYMSNIYSWINRKLWTVYEYQTEEEKRKEEFNFSQDVL
jgi:hypothetical protein